MSFNLILDCQREKKHLQQPRDNFLYPVKNNKQNETPVHNKDDKTGQKLPGNRQRQKVKVVLYQSYLYSRHL